MPCRLFLLREQVAPLPDCLLQASPTVRHSQPPNAPNVHDIEAENKADQSWHHLINHHQLYNYNSIEPGTLDT